MTLKKDGSWVWRCLPMLPAMWEAGMGGSLKPSSSRPV